MPIRGVILILVLAVVFAFIFREEIYDDVKRIFPEDKDKDDEEDIYKEIEE